MTRTTRASKVVGPLLRLTIDHRRVENKRMAYLDEKKVSHILQALREMDYGSLVITVHNDEITQIDKTEKKRFSLNKKSEAKK